MKIENKYKIKGFLLVVFLFSALTVFTYSGLTATFFQQDEWQYFGADISALASNHPIMNTILPFKGQLTHFFPLATLFFLIEYVIFKMNFPAYAIVNLALHLANTILIFLLFRKIIKRDDLSFAAAGLFLINSRSHQVVTWIAAGIGTLPATFLILLSLIFFTDYLENKKLIYFLGSIFFFFLSLFFKEISLFLFIFYPFILIFYNFNRKKIMTVVKPLLFLLGTAGLYFSMRLAFLFFTSIRSAQPDVGAAGSMSSVPSLTTYIFRIIAVPLKGISQAFFPEKLMINIADVITAIAYPNFSFGREGVNPYISQVIVFDLLSYLGTIAILIFSFDLLYFLKRQEYKKFSQIVFFSFLFIATSLLPFIFIPGNPGYFSIFEPRNLYLATIGTSLIIVIFIFIITNIFWKGKIQKILSLAILTIIFLINIFDIKNDIGNLENLGKQSKLFLTLIEKKYPKLPNSVVIYTESDRPYYGLTEEQKILPVQSGFGRMILVWYQEEEKFPACLYENQYLYETLSQGYKNCDGRGFGYFRDYDKLLKAVKENNISKNSIIAYKWNGNTKEFYEISDDIRDKIFKVLK